MATSIILLGFSDKKIQHETSWKVNKIGGIPDLFKDVPAREDEIKPRCQICGRIMPMVVQLCCPLSISTYHRNLYIFCCINEPCWNKCESWKVMRCQFSENGKQITGKQDPQVTQASDKIDPWLMDEDSWGHNDNCQGTADDRLLVDETMQMTLQAEECKGIDDRVESSATIDYSNQNSMVLAESPPKVGTMPSFVETRPGFHLFENLEPVFCSFHINVFEEAKSESEESTSEHVQSLMNDYYLHEGNPFYKTKESSDGKTSQAEGYERTEVKHGDRVFHKFLKRVAEHPQQVIRYCWEGHPLHMTSSVVEPPPCQSCGNKRVFELQLMPMLLHSLKLENVPTCETAVEFGTVIISTCSNSCWFAGDTRWKLEHVALEVDPDEALFKRPNTSL